MNTAVTMKKSNGIKKQVRKKPFDVIKVANKPDIIYIARFENSYEAKSLKKG